MRRKAFRSPTGSDTCTSLLRPTSPTISWSAKFSRPTAQIRRSVAQARFYLDRDGEANVLTRDVGRIFLGVDLQCAQCHDHPLVTDYYQADYQGLYAFFNRTSLFTDKEKHVSLAEKADGDVNYQSVFDASRKGTALPKLPDGDPVAEPTFNKGEEYVVAPADGVRPVPKHSRRAQLAPQVTSGSRMFARAIANRLWAHMMGRGLVEPVDMHHTDNPPSQPAVLQLLAGAFPAMQYDIKALLGQLARTRAYGRSIDLPLELSKRGAEIEPQLAAWEAEKAELDATRMKSRDAAAAVGAELSQARTAAAPVADELAKAQAAAAEAKKNADTAAQALANAQTLYRPGRRPYDWLPRQAPRRTKPRKSSRTTRSWPTPRPSSKPAANNLPPRSPRSPKRLPKAPLP